MALYIRVHCMVIRALLRKMTCNLRHPTSLRHPTLYESSRTLQHTATHCNTLQHTVSRDTYSVPWLYISLYIARWDDEIWTCCLRTHTRTCLRIRCGDSRRTLQHAATHCNTLQHTVSRDISHHLRLRCGDKCECASCEETCRWVGPQIWSNVKRCEDKCTSCGDQCKCASCDETCRWVMQVCVVWRDVWASVALDVMRCRKMCADECGCVACVETCKWHVKRCQVSVTLDVQVTCDEMSRQGQVSVVLDVMRCRNVWRHVWVCGMCRDVQVTCEEISTQGQVSVILDVMRCQNMWRQVWVCVMWRHLQVSVVLDVMRSQDVWRHECVCVSCEDTSCVTWHFFFRSWWHDDTWLWYSFVFDFDWAIV